MADEQIDALILAARFDPSGLEAIPAEITKALRKAQEGVPELELFDAAKLRAQLQAEGVDVGQFFAGVRDEIGKTDVEANRLVDALEKAFTPRTSPLVGGGGGGGSGPPDGPNFPDPDFSVLIQPANAATAAIHPLAAAMATATKEAELNAAANAKLARSYGVGVGPVANMTAILSRAAGSSTAMTRAMATASGPIDRVGESSRRTADGVQRVGLSSRETAQHFVSMAAAGLGADSTIARMAANVLALSVGFGALTVAAGSIFAVVKAYELLTATTRKAREEQDKLLAAQGTRQAAAADPGNLQATIIADQIRLVDLKKEQARWEEVIRTDTKLGAATLQQHAKVAELRNEVLRVQVALEKDVNGLIDQRQQKLTNEFNTATALAKAQTDLKLAALSTAPELGTDTVASARERRLEETRLRAITRDTTISLVERNEAQQQLNALQKASLFYIREAEARQRAETEAIEASVRAQADFLSNLQQINSEEADRIAKAKADQDRRLGLDPEKQTGPIDTGFDQARSLAESMPTPGDFAEESVASSHDLADTWKQVRDHVVVSAVAALGLGRATEDIVFDAIDLADAFGGISQANKAFSQAESDLAAATTQAQRLSAEMDKSAASVQQIAAIGGLIGAGLGIAGAIGNAVFGSGPSATERLLAENNQRLEELGGHLDRFKGRLGLGEVGSFADLAQPISEGGEGIIGFRKGLADAGISLEAYAKIARDTTGIQILDDEGRLSAQALGQLREAIVLARDAALDFGTSSAEIMARMETEDKLGIGGRSEDPEVARVERIRDTQLEQLHLSDQEEARIRAIDLSTAEGRKQFMDEERKLFEQAKNHTLGSDTLGGFENIDELSSSIGDAADAVDAFGNAVNEAVKGLTNIPETFKLAGAELAARAVDSATTSASSPTRFTGPLVNAQAAPASTPTTPPAGTPTTGPATTAGVIVTGNVITLQFTVPANMSPGDVARRVKAEFEAEAQATFGLGEAP